MPNGNGTNGKRQYGLRVSLEGFPSKTVRDLRFSKEGNAYLRFAFKVPSDGKGGQDIWLNVVAFKDLAQAIAELMDGPLREGVLLRVEGELFSHRTKDGTELRLIARSVAFVPIPSKVSGVSGVSGSGSAKGNEDEEFPPEDELPF